MNQQALQRELEITIARVGIEAPLVPGSELWSFMHAAWVAFKAGARGEVTPQITADDPNRGEKNAFFRVAYAAGRGSKKGRK